MSYTIDSELVLKSLSNPQHSAPCRGHGMNRRSALRGMLMGAAGLALSPITLSQIDIPVGQVRLVFNENPYGPSPKALEAVAHILAENSVLPGRDRTGFTGTFYGAPSA